MIIFQTIRIPATTMLHGFSCDEGMLVETVAGKKYDIQIEHSEGDGQHKSNIIEFIGRTVMRYGTPTIAELKTLISSLGYQYHPRTELFETSLEPSVVPIEGRIVYATFLSFANQLFKR